mmetsp:Transcript_33088/g.70517  ORF Transcript_33088/g.70517 Transcript_33088/m.70517 type:complete len:215 (+) Transcript_33088:222-866(+)
MEEQGEDSQEMMMGLMQQFNQLQMQHQEMQHQEEQNTLETMQHQQVQHHHRHHLGHHDGDGADSKFSDITPSSSYHVLKTTINSNARGRSMEPGPDNGRLGTHSTLANSRTHTPVPASPGLDSNFAIKSHTTGTENDVEFLHEGVNAFYEERAATSESFESANNSKGAGVAPKWLRVARPKASRHHSQHALQQHFTSRSKSRSTKEGEAQQTQY